MPSKLSIYLSKKFLSSFLIVFFIFSILLLIGDFVEQFRKATGKEVPLKIIFQLAIYNFLNLTTFVLPISAFFGSLMAFLFLIKNSELLVIGSNGISIYRLLMPAAILYFAIGLFFITIINPLTAAFHESYTVLEYKYINKTDKFASITKNGLWLKQYNSERKLSSVLFAKKVSNNGTLLNEFMVLEYDENGAFQGRLDGKKAILQDRFWRMEDVQISPKYDQASFLEEMDYSTNVNPSDITNSLSAPVSISFWRIGSFISFLETLGYSARDFKMHYYSLLILPFFIMFLAIMAASMVADLKQNDSFSKVIFFSFILIFFIYFLSNLFDALGSSSQISPFVSKLVTPLFVIFVSICFFQYSSIKRKKIF